MPEVGSLGQLGRPTHSGPVVSALGTWAWAAPIFLVTNLIRLLVPFLLKAWCRRQGGHPGLASEVAVEQSKPPWALLELAKTEKLRTKGYASKLIR